MLIGATLRAVIPQRYLDQAGKILFYSVPVALAIMLVLVMTAAPN